MAGVEKPKKYSDGRVYYRAATACPITTLASDVVHLTVELLVNGSVILATRGLCSQYTPPYSVAFCSIEGRYLDPSGSQAYRTDIYLSRITTETGGSVWNITPMKTDPVTY